MKQGFKNKLLEISNKALTPQPPLIEKQERDVLQERKESIFNYPNLF